ncbi:hypothetical protein K435DRAFT_771825 [Dendrothele bispora CBS 962.96]|uniref:Uncharacterized protein n=1 Tax=Dendrothele bispora (strain CBS 962.96) TaxID=1314807 RepID=A0A4S8MXY1_DENBC|nr:hypothetical protein K435DRAFT_771825 [Dendrothele bispora CBS 962.96]
MIYTNDVYYLRHDIVCAAFCLCFFRFAFTCVWFVSDSGVNCLSYHDPYINFVLLAPLSVIPSSISTYPFHLTQ